MAQQRAAEEAARRARPGQRPPVARGRPAGPTVTQGTPEQRKMARAYIDRLKSAGWDPQQVVDETGKEYLNTLGPSERAPIPKERWAELGIPQSGGSYSDQDDIPISPHDILSILAKHYAWQELKEQYDSLEPEYRQLLPEPEDSEIHVLTQPMNRYIDEFADEDLVEEARNAVDLLSPDDMESLFDDGEPMSRIVPHYAMALPQTKEEWIPVMVKADILRRYM